MNFQDRRLARRMLTGEERAFDDFFEGYFPGLYRFAMSRMNYDTDAAEEVTQATLCKAISKMHTYRGEASLFTWLCTFCRHEISAFFKSNRRQPEAVNLLEESSEVLSALETLWALNGNDPEEALRRQELVRLVHVVLDRLPSSYANALEWKYIDGIPVKEIATRMGLGAKAAESLLTRSRQAFRDGFSTLTRSLPPLEPAAGESP